MESGFSFDDFSAEFEEFEVVVKKTISEEEKIGEERYQTAIGAVDLESDYHFRSEYSFKSEYQTKS
jgi:hypothetical protein